MADETTTADELASVGLPEPSAETATAFPDPDEAPATDYRTHDIVLYVQSAGQQGFEDYKAERTVMFGQVLKINDVQVMHPPAHPNLHYGLEDLMCHLDFGVQGFLEFWIENTPEGTVEALGITENDWLEGTGSPPARLGLPVRSFTVLKFDAPEVVPFMQGEGIGESAEPTEPQP